MNRNIKLGIILGLGAYLMWGFLPIYWKYLESVRPDVVLSHRIIWSCIFMLLIVLFTKQTRSFITECRRILHQKKTLIIITTASILISLNWLIFIWAVQNEYVIQTSLGYYMNPLINVLLSVVFLKETLSKAQITAVALAAIGVIYLTLSYGVFPWVSIVLALTFSIYGLLKKIVQLSPTFSLAIETLIVTPIAIIYLLFTFGPGIGMAGNLLNVNILLVLAGVATAIPLLLFGTAVQHISLSMVGFLQYIAPTIMLFIGIFLYNEAFTKSHLFAFVFIWIALIIYVASTLKPKKQRNISHNL